MSIIKQKLLDIIESQNDEIDIDSDLEFIYNPPSPVDIQVPSRTELLGE